MYSQLGNIVFEQLVGFDSWQRKNEAVIPEHPLLEGKPRLQKTGQKLKQHDVTIQFHSMFCTPEVELNALNIACENGEVMPFVNGTGEYLGDFVITSINEDMKQTDAIGNIILISVSFSLLEFIVQNKITDKERQAKKKGFANTANSPTRKKIVLREQGEAHSIMKSQNDVRKTTNNAGNAITAAKNNAAQSESLLRKAQRNLKKAQKALQDVNRKLTEAKHAYQSTLRIKQAIVQTATYVGNAVTAASTGDIDGALNANRELQKAVSRQSGACSEVATLTSAKVV